MYGIKDEFVTIENGYQLHIRATVPKGDRVIFFVHGAGGYADQWHSQMKYFSKHARVVSYDWLGHGMSQKPDPKPGGLQYTFKLLYDGLSEVFKTYSGEKNYVVAHSYGGALTMQLALRHHAAIQRLALLAPVPCRPYELMPWVWSLPLPVLDKMRAALSERFGNLAFDRRADPALVRREIEAIMNNPIRMMRSLVTGMHDIPKLDLKRVNQKSLVVAGVADRVITLNEIEECYLNIDKLQFEIMPQCGHMIMLEKSVEINEKIKQFFH